jgi:hypothetical protein
MVMVKELFALRVVMKITRRKRKGYRIFIIRGNQMEF